MRHVNPFQSIEKQCFDTKFRLWEGNQGWRNGADAMICSLATDASTVHYLLAGRFRIKNWKNANEQLRNVLLDVLSK